MGESQHVLGAHLGRLTAWRDRGSAYSEGIRTSGQFGMLGAGVAKGAGFTDTGWAIAIGLTLALGIEAFKIVTGWLDYKFHVFHTQQRMVAEANPLIMRQVDALERIAPPPCHCGPTSVNPKHLVSCPWRQWRDERRALERDEQGDGNRSNFGLISRKSVM